MTDIDSSAEAVAGLLRSTTPVRPISPRDEAEKVTAIVAVTARMFFVTPEEVLSKARETWATNARLVAIAVARANTSLSLPELGVLFDRDHTTVLSAVRRVMNTPVLRQWAAAVDAELNADLLSTDSHNDAHRESPNTTTMGGGPGDVASAPGPWPTPVYEERAMSKGTQSTEALP